MNPYQNQPNQYRKPAPPRSLTPTLISGWKTPKLKVIFSNVIKPYYYPNVPQVPRYSITLVVDPIKNMDFVDQVTKMEKNENCATQFRVEIKKDENGFSNPTGKYLMKFHTREDIPIFKLENGKPVPFELTKEIPRDSELEITFDVSRYTSKQNGQNGLLSKATQILIHEMPTPTYKTYDAPESESAPF